MSTVFSMDSRFQPSWMALRTARSLVGKSWEFRLKKIAVPETPRWMIVKPWSVSGFSSVVPTSSVASMVPEARDPVRTLASGIVLKTILSRYAAPPCSRAGGDQL